MKRFTYATLLLFATMLVFSLVASAEDNPIGAIETPATVEVGGGVRMMSMSFSAEEVTEVPTLTPDYLSATLKPGESIVEKKVGYIPGAPPAGELMFVLDLTGSMGGELANAKANSVNIMNAVAGVITSMKFGVASHMDYPGTYGGCGYGPTIYGAASSGDYQYSLDQGLTSSTAAVAAAINALTLGYGGDGPESYKTAIAEMASLGWSSGVKRIAVLWGDDRPHDCAIGTGEEPGLDGVSMVEVMGDLAAANVTTIFLHSGSYLAYWQGMAALAGGVAFKINGDGTVPGGTPIAEKIVELIEAEVATIDEVTLEVCDPAYADWLTSATPVYAGVEPPVTMGFGITITVPEGTEAGEYCFKVCLVGDGAVYATQEVCITVVTCIEVEIDNKLTPQTFNVQRGEKNSTVKLHINYSPMPIAAAMIVSVGGYDTLIVSGGGNGPLSFSSAEFSEVAALVVPEGAPRAENVSVVIVLEFEDGSFSCPIVGYLDIINEGGKK